MRNIGYEYLALEVNKNTLEKGHLYDILRFYDAYGKGKNTNEMQFPNAQPGWIDLIKEAMDEGYKIRFIDVARKNESGNLPRDRAMFEEIKKEIFDKKSNAKVIVYIGAKHISEYEAYQGTSLYEKDIKPLGYFLNNYTNGRNFSIYMGNTYDSPAGCDLFISNFIWDIYDKKD